MKLLRILAAAFAALFLSSQVLATSHGDRTPPPDRLKTDDAPAVFEYIL